MFCSKCGSEAQVNAKFCDNCGNSLSGDVAPAARTDDVAVEKIFMDQHGVYVSDAMFKLASGKSYPIRNLTSVVVSRKSGSILLFIISLFITLLGLMLLVSSPVVGLVTLLFSGMSWTFFMQRDWQLKIGAGGIIQVAIEDKNKNYLDSVATAINESLVYLQRK
ncbi:zinc ribbon domain-containing protein [Undibacterium sp. CY18W]|uniref:Zinc ribbon domain-containing protein n=1 Tax=Undibacterium hunanense TaxID=2762292 RepID=A0ABR6ZW77_9BURK|nr:DUF6232 family protein [Undibacterium hunanense]MBC3920137.1 zinc ribbon domain-containing protein [Undibacterium hunanense]